jgi:hypothetical protein
MRPRHSSVTGGTGGRWSMRAIGAILFLFATGASALYLPVEVRGPAPTAQVGVPYSSALTVSVPSTMRRYGIEGSLPPGLTLDGAMGAISGTPTIAGGYTFVGWVAGTMTPPPGGLPILYPMFGQSEFTITVLPPVATVPISRRTLALVVIGLSSVGLLRLRQRSAHPDPSPRALSLD